MCRESVCNVVYRTVPYRTVLWSTQSGSFIVHVKFYFSLQQEKALSLIAVRLEYVNFCNFTTNKVREWYEN
jgi:hypothetical protein